MKKTLLILSFIIITVLDSYSQVWESIGGGVLDFLLENPSTVNNMNTSEVIGARIISDLLKTQSERQYRLKYANAGADKITINTNDGRQAQFVKDENDNIYIILGGVVYPISQNFVNKAKNIDDNPNKDTSTSSNIQPYSLKELNDNYTRSNINKFNVRCLFSYKWSKDFDGDGNISFNEFKYIKNTFKETENFKIAIDYETIKEKDTELILEINDDYTGELLFSKIQNVSSNTCNNLMYYNILSGELPVGIYLLIAKLQDSNTKEKHSSIMSTIQITQPDSSATREYYRSNIMSKKIHRPQTTYYKTIKIGNQVWMADNLNDATSNSWCYDNISSNNDTYGRLYTWDVAKNTCPDGWHLPSEAEWRELERDTGFARKKDKRGWLGKHGFNLKLGGESGFNALTVGAYNCDKDKLYHFNEYGYYWTSSEFNETHALFIGFRDTEERVRLDYGAKKTAMSVRCIQD